MKLAVFGGSFNPLHIGHVMVAETVIKELGYDKVLFIPTCVPPHKETAKGSASGEDRLGMIRCFCEDENTSEDMKFLFDSCEIDRGGISYTVDTLSYVISKYGDSIEGKPGLIMGEEIAAEFHKWKKPDKIAELADLIVVPRVADYSKEEAVKGRGNKPSGNYTGDFSVPFDGRKFGYNYKMISDPVISVSSTDIRNRVANGKSFKYLVPSAVFKYIEEKKLYR